MLKKLRWKFIFINMSLVSVVLLAVFTTLYISSYNKFKSDSSRFLENILYQNYYSIPHKKEPKPPPDYKISFFTVALDKDMNIIKTDIQGSNMDSSIVTEAVKSIDITETEAVVINDLNLRYLIKETNDGFIVAFTDISKDKNYLLQLVTFSIIIAIGALMVFFIISLYLSKYALKPVEIAWKKQQQFVADASHELKTPLTVMLATTSLLLSSEEKPTDVQAKWIRYIESEAARMQRLVKDLLFLAKSDESKDTSMKTVINLSDIVENCVLLFEPVAFENNFTIDSEVLNDIFISGDSNQIKQLIMILLDNSIKHGKKNTKISVCLKTVPGKGIITVNNMGDPISDEDMPYLFDRFYRADKSRDRTSNSHGLGLSIAEEIVKIHKGKISVQSTVENGTTFKVQLPLTQI